MSVIAEVSGRDPVVVEVTPADTVAALLAALHARLQLPRPVADYEVVIPADDGGPDTVLDMGHIASSGSTLSSAGVFCLDDRLEVRVKFAFIARERVGEAGIVTEADAVAAIRHVLRDATADTVAEEAGLARIELIKATGLVTTWTLQLTCLACLHDAAMALHTARMRRALAAGAAINGTLSNNHTVLYEAARRGRADVIDFLIEHGADVGARETAGCAPLFAAAVYGHVDAVRALLRHGASPDAQDKRGRTALYAATMEREDITAILLEHGASPDLSGPDGVTPLNAIAGYGRTGRVRLLLHHGASPDTKDAAGRSPLLAATARGCVENVELLLAHGASPDTRDAHGRTPLHVAATAGSADIVALLIRHGAVVDARTRPPSDDAAAHTVAGATPLWCAVSNGRAGVVQLLVSRKVGRVWTAVTDACVNTAERGLWAVGWR